MSDIIGEPTNISLDKCYPDEIHYGIGLAEKDGPTLKVVFSERMTREWFNRVVRWIENTMVSNRHWIEEEQK